jgi:integrase
MAKEVGAIGEQQIQALLGEPDVRDKALLALFALGGFTVHEVHDIRREDVHLDASPPSIEMRLGGRGYMPRPRSLDAQLAEDLDKYLRATPGAQGKKPLILGAGGEPLTMRQMQRISRDVSQRVGLGPMTPSQLRLSCIKRWQAQRVPLEEIRDRLGLSGLTFLQALVPTPPRRQKAPRPRISRRRGPGRPLLTRRDAILAELVDVRGMTYKEAADYYNEHNPPLDEVSRWVVQKAVQAWRRRHPTESDATNGE